MCLSDAFELIGGERRPLMHYVSGISVEDGTVTLTDMLGARKTVAGTLKPPPRGLPGRHCPLHGVAPDRVYSAALFPAGG